MSSLSELRFFTTPAHDCSYLEGRQAITLFADPLAHIDTELYSSLSEVGFRRSGAHIYRPYCESCTACIPARVPVAAFKPRRRQRRIWKRNTDLVVTAQRPAMTDEYFDLYRRYIVARHADGDMYPAETQQFQSFLVEGRPEAVFFEFRLAPVSNQDSRQDSRQDKGKLLAVAVADELIQGLSAIYTFFEPDDDKRSLGSYAVQWLIEETLQRGLRHLYLGYWIKQCRKMSYKRDYTPLEMYINNRWIRVEPTDAG